MLDMHLQNNKRGTVYEVAEAIDRGYVTSRSFRMMFLRASRYNPEEAARQVIKYLELKRTLFDQEKITKRIVMTDLNHEDREYLASGAVQVSTKRDRSGRAILAFFPSLKTNTSVEAELRARYYVVMNMLESEEIQKNGVVFVYFGALPTLPHQHSSNSGILWDLPIYLSGLHCCFDDLSYYILISVAILRLPFKLRPRMRVHYGSCSDCLTKLSSFGIPREALLLTNVDEPIVDDHLQWYRQQEEREMTYVTDSDAETLSVASTIGGIVPRAADVLFGAGSRKNEGNLLMRNLVLAMLDEHNEARKGRKMQLTENVIEEVKKTGGRFLKQNEETKQWEEASHVEACRKIAHTFRNIRRPSRAKKKS